MTTTVRWFPLTQTNWKIAQARHAVDNSDVSIRNAAESTTHAHPAVNVDEKLATAAIAVGKASKRLEEKRRLRPNSIYLHFQTLVHHDTEKRIIENLRTVNMAKQLHALNLNTGDALNLNTGDNKYIAALQHLTKYPSGPERTAELEKTENLLNGVHRQLAAVQAHLQARAPRS